jgi:hypothetical protein
MKEAKEQSREKDRYLGFLLSAKSNSWRAKKETRRAAGICQPLRRVPQSPKVMRSSFDTSILSPADP